MDYGATSNVRENGKLDKKITRFLSGKNAFQRMLVPQKAVIFARNPMVPTQQTILGNVGGTRKMDIGRKGSRKPERSV